MKLIELLRLLPLADWIALAGFFTAWIGYVWFAKRRDDTVGSLLATTNRYRRLWMLQTTHRENRVVDGVVVQNLSTSPSFFASTTILIIGGLLAVIGASERATELVREIPFAARTPLVVIELKLLLLTGIFVYAFFRLTRSMHRYAFGALLIASMPDHAAFARGEAKPEEFAERAGRIVGLAAETFNDGLRAYYMAFAALLWFVSPLASAFGTHGIVFVPYRREFHSDVLALLRQCSD